MVTTVVHPALTEESGCRSGPEDPSIDPLNMTFVVNINSSFTLAAVGYQSSGMGKISSRLLIRC